MILSLCSDVGMLHLKFFGIILCVIIIVGIQICERVKIVG